METPVKKLLKEKTLQDLTNIPTKQLPREAKIVSSKALNDLNFQVADIASILGLGERSVWRYIKEEEMPKAIYWQDFGTMIKKLIESKQDILRAKSLHHIDEKMPQASFRDLVGWYKVASDTIREDARVSINSQQTVVFQVTKDNK